MSDEQTSERGPMPDATIEPGEPNPGGADARQDSDGVDNGQTEGEPLSRDLDPDQNPAVDTVLPEEAKQTEDTDTAATRGDGDTDEETDVADKEEPA